MKLGRGDGTVGNLIELKFLNSSFSTSNLSIRAVRARPLIEARQTVPCRAIRGKSSDSRQQYLSQQYHPPVLEIVWHVRLDNDATGQCVEGFAA